MAINWHRRWFCLECKREWHDVDQTNANGGIFMVMQRVTVTGNPPNNENCPICGSPDIEERLYKPRFPGLDIPRHEGGEYTVLPKQKTITTIRGLINTQSVSVKTDSKDLPKDFKITPETSKEVKILQDTPLPLIESVKMEIAHITPKEESIYDLSDMD